MLKDYPQSDEQFPQIEESLSVYSSADNLEEQIALLKKKMNDAANALEFEKAAILRDRIKTLEKMILFEL